LRVHEEMKIDIIRLVSIKCMYWW